VSDRGCRAPAATGRHLRTGKRTSGCLPPPADDSDASLAVIVRAYIAHCRPGAHEELSSFRAEPTLAAAIQRAGMAMRTDGKRYDHQRRIPLAALEAATSRLRRAPLHMARDFDQLLRTVGRIIRPVHGVGELTVYDTALRIGSKLDLLPTRVYLHSGTREGARALDLNWRAPYLEPEDFPPEFLELQPHEIEDCLCIFRSRFARRRAPLLPGRPNLSPTEPRSAPPP
jgi:hypothetical protein